MVTRAGHVAATVVVALEVVVYVLAATAALTVLQRVLHVRRALRSARV